MSERATSSAPARAPHGTAPARTGLRVVPAQRTRSRSRQVVLGIVLVVMFVAFLASAVFHSVLVSGQQRLDRMDDRLQQHEQELSRAELRVARLKSPARVVAAAQARGMVLPAHTTWLSAKPPTSAVPGTSGSGQSPTSVPGGAERASGGAATPAGQQAGPDPGR